MSQMRIRKLSGFEDVQRRFDRRIAKIRELRNIWETPLGQATQTNILMAVKPLWGSNIYRYFNAERTHAIQNQIVREQKTFSARKTREGLPEITQSTGQLGRAGLVSIQPRQLVVEMDDIYHEYVYPPTSKKRGDMMIWEYGQYIRRGTSASPGAFVACRGIRFADPQYGVGTHPGVSPEKYWKPFLRWYASAVREIVKQQAHIMIREQMRRIKRGI